MNSLKFVSMFIGVIAAAAIATFPLAAFAQDAPPQNQPTPQAGPRIQLSNEQEAQFKAIQATAIASIEKVLNADQQKQFAAGRENGQGLGAIEGLTDQQKQDIIEVLKRANSEIGALLTVEQKEQIQRSMSNQSQQQQR